MYLHIMPDEKIINRTIQFFEKAHPNQNHFIILLPEYRAACKSVDIEANVNVRVVTSNSKSLNTFVENIANYDSVIVHYLSLEAANVINRITHSNIYWIEWGGDMYNSFLRRKGFKLYHNEKEIALLKNPYIPYIFQKVFRFFREYSSFRSRYEAVKKIKYFVPDSMEDEYSLFIKYYPEFSHLKYREFFYYPIQEIVGKSNWERRANGPNIFVGNSASETNNHLEIFSIIENVVSNRKVVVPLSYGSSSKYVNYICEKGEKMLKNQFAPIRNFMSLSEYNELFYSASHFIYGNYRQEAVGNILFALFIGGKVYLHKTNPLYEFYKRIGIVIFAIEDIDEVVINQPLNDSDYINNRKIIQGMYSSERLINLIKTSFLND